MAKNKQPRNYATRERDQRKVRIAGKPSQVEQTFDLMAVELEDPAGAYVIPFPDPTDTEPDQVRNVELIDPRTLTLEDLALVANPAFFFKVVIPEDDYTFVIDQRIEMFRIQALIPSYMAHFGLETEGNARGSGI